MRKNDGKFITPEEKYVEACLSLAVYKLLQQDAENCNDALSADETNCIEQTAKGTLPQMLNFIRKKERSIHSRNVVKKSVMRIAKIAVIVVVFVNIGVTFAIAANKTVRANVIQFLQKIDESSIQIGYKATDNFSIEVPTDWNAKYFPAYTPKGYEMYEHHCSEECNSITYRSSSGNEIEISISDIHSFSSYNVQEAEILNIPINNFIATVVCQPTGKTDIIWSVGDSYIIVSAECERTEAIKVAESVSLIDINLK